MRAHVPSDDGFAVAAAGVFLASGWVTSRGHRTSSAAGGESIHTTDIGPSPSMRDLFIFQMQTVGFMLLVQWVVQMDLWYVAWWGPYDADVTVALPIAENAEPGTAAKVLTEPEAARALYASAQLFSQISYSLVISLTFVLFPLISGIGSDKTAARAYTQEALRYAMIMVVGVAVCLTSVPGETMNLLLGNLPAALELVPDGHEALRWLGLGYVAFALLFVVCAVLNAAGRPRHSMALIAIAFATQAGTGFALLPDHGIVGQGVAGLLAMGAALVVGLIYMSRWIGNVIPTATVIRVVIAGAAAYALALAWHPEGKMMALVRITLCGVVYLIGIIAMREFGADDVAKFKKVLPGGKKA